MIPILFDSSATTYTTNGIGRLTDCISCLVTEERNGIYEVEFEYPITGVHYSDIVEGNIIVVTHDEQKDKQPFVIYRTSKPINGIVTVNAHHISYNLSNVIISPFTASSASDAMTEIGNHAMNDNPFTYWTDKASAGDMNVTVPTPAKLVLGGKRGSILDTYGGEYEFDGYTVKLYANRGNDNGVTIRYGKNLTDVTAERDTLGLYNSVIPYWSDNKNTVVYGGIVVGNGGVRRSAYWNDERGVQIKDENDVAFEFSYLIRQITTMDLSDKFDDPPTVAELEAMARTTLNSNTPWLPNDTIKIDFIALWQTEEYKNVAPLERVRLCDWVTVYYPALGVNAKAEVVKVVWDVLTERYTNIEIGRARASFADVITAETDAKIEEMPNMSTIERAIGEATNLITGGMGGHIVFLFDAEGKPTDMLVMDTDDVETAIHVLRINVNGIGFSSTGVSGTYTSAWTLDGSFVADFITAGTMSANRIQGGTLAMGGADNGNGTIIVYDADGNEIGRWDNGGIEMYAETGVGFFGSVTAKELNGYLDTIYNYLVPGFAVTTSNDRYNYASIATKGRILKQVIAENIANGTQGDADEEVYLYNTSKTHLYKWNVSHGRGYWMRLLEMDTSGAVEIGQTGEESVENYSEPADFVVADGGFGYGFCNLATGSSSRYQVSSWRFERNTEGCMMTLNGSAFCVAIDTSESSTTAGRMEFTSSGLVVNGNYVNTSSSIRYKHDVTEDIDDGLDAHRLYDLKLKQYIYNEGKEQYLDTAGKTLPGFIAEDVDAIYPAAAIHNENGEVESWDERRIVPPMLKLIQEQHAEIESLKARLSELEKAVEKLMR